MIRKAKKYGDDSYCAISHNFDIIFKRFVSCRLTRYYNRIVGCGYNALSWSLLLAVPHEPLCLPIIFTHFHKLDQAFYIVCLDCIFSKTVTVYHVFDFLFHFSLDFWIMLPFIIKRKSYFLINLSFQQSQES